MQSVEAIYREHSKTVYRYLLSLTHSEDIAEELTQETFYQAVKSIERYDGSCKINTWLCAIAKNSLSVYCRKHPKTVLPDDIAQASASAESEALLSLGHLELLQRLHGLPDETREVMYLRLLGDLSFREIGDILSRTENWARVTYYRGREKLKKEYEENEPKT